MIQLKFEQSDVSCLTVGELIEALESYPMDTPVVTTGPSLPGYYGENVEWRQTGDIRNVLIDDFSPCFFDDPGNGKGLGRVAVAII